ncbi:MAG: uracil-DNA glycosylase, partial [Gemmatimonadaceae bacterium]|nr:uracil-DNA glycosylase [Acetobacteraceae bacterium]
MDSLAALRLQIEWGADEALGELPRSHFQPEPAAAPVVARAPSRVVAPSVAAPPVAANDLDTLHAALAAFDGCPLRATATSTV